jgi:hypothetical protein
MFRVNKSQVPVEKAGPVEPAIAFHLGHGVAPTNASALCKSFGELIFRLRDAANATNITVRTQ